MQLVHHPRKGAVARQDNMQVCSPEAFNRMISNIPSHFLSDEAYPNKVSCPFPSFIINPFLP